MSDIRDYAVDSQWSTGMGEGNPETSRKLRESSDAPNRPQERKATGMDHAVTSAIKFGASCSDFGDGRYFVRGKFGNTTFRAEDVLPETLQLFLSRVTS